MQRLLTAISFAALATIGHDTQAQPVVVPKAFVTGQEFVGFI
jgi:hypothetical protein